MVELNLQRLASAKPVPGPQTRKPLGACLLDRGVITRSQLVRALHMQAQQNAPLGEILVGEGWASRQDVLSALSDQSGWQIADLDGAPPTSDLCSLKPVEFWMAHNVIPWLRMGPLILVATANPDAFESVANELQEGDLTIVPVLASTDQIDRAIAACYAPQLAKAAESRVDARQSCRNWNVGSRLRALSVAVALCAICFAAPQAGLAVVFWAAVVTLILFMLFRVFGAMTTVLNVARQK